MRVHPLSFFLDRGRALRYAENSLRHSLDLRADEAPERVLGGAHDLLTTNVEARIHKDGSSGLLMK
jgi:hypothetical protein